ncbi:MAG: transcriptional repressor LexA [Spirochaetales bacterium]|jgi:repressor LexA|nr:transcriptional repressor LexA [Spirochaetales bacterium]
MKGLTARQKEVLEFIRNFIYEHNFPPTIREIAGYFHFSAKSAHDHVRAMGKKGFLGFNKNRSRTIEILDGSGIREEGQRKIPIVGTVAAGNPVFADENLEGYLRVSERYLKKGDYFALRVKGDSMINAGILEGDMAIIAKQNEVHNGDIVVALVNDENATLKRFYEEKNRVRLEAENPGYKTRYEQKHNVFILGRLAHVMRSYE